MKKLHALIILDGFGIAADTSVSAIDKVGIPVIRKYMSEYPTVAIGASGMDVGLPDGQMGNSEVGHMNIGAGRVVYQELTRITKAIADGDFFENEALLHAVRSAKEKGKKLHLMGLLSDGGVHSHIEHLYGLLSLAKKEGLSEVYVHCFMDGRDVSPVSGAGYLSALQAKMAELGVGKIATVSGRYYAMDRDNRWERVQKAYDCLTGAKAELTDDPVGYVQASYKDGVTDEFIVPVKNTLADGAVQREDSVIFFNFRPDRAREMTRALTQEAFDGFSRELLNLTYVCMTQYDATFKGIEIAFKPQSLVNTLGEYLAAQGKKQLRIAETEKYAHVTFFFNGGVEAPNANEDRTLVASPKVATYDLQPEMSAYEVTVKAIAAVQSGA
ncbi:MAG: 2,3-bisphosphoglycerate-independent phosphoglycerate mutase, partial [Clostridia bacterium]|nr:2,3-bisphosphoglycerate-independent phosphoglycerate mutase [Clostridia bacterium]